MKYAAGLISLLFSLLLLAICVLCGYAAWLSGKPDGMAAGLGAVIVFFTAISVGEWGVKSLERAAAK